MLRTILAGLLLAVATIIAAPNPLPASAGGGCHGAVSNGLTDEATTSVSMEGCAFVPSVARIQSGDSVEWTNNDDKAIHAVTGVAESWGNFQEHSTGQTVTYKFAEPGIYPYFCQLHPGMVGAIVVGDGASIASEADAARAVSAVAPAAAHDAAAQAATDDSDSSRIPWIVAALAFGLVAGAVSAAVITCRQTGA